MLKVSLHSIGWSILLGAFLFGCSREQVRDGVVVSVCGKVLTTAEIAARGQNVVVLFGHRRGGVTNGLEGLAKQFASGYAAYWVEDTVLADAAEKAGVEPGAVELATCRKHAFLNFRAKGDRSFDDLRKIEGLDLRYWEDQVRAEALRATMERVWAEQEPTNLPPDYAEGQIRLMEEWNVSMAETNRLQFAKASNVWERIRGGLDFNSAAKTYSEIEDERVDAGDWAVVDAKFLADDPVLLAWLRAAKPGDISPPIEADNGIMIARLDSLEKDEGFAVSRIFFRKGNVLTPAPKEEIVAAAKARYAKELFSRKLAELVKAARPDFKSQNKQDKNNQNRETKE